MSRLDANITHGDLNVRIRHGGGSDALIQVGLLAGIVIAVAVIIVQLMWWILAAGSVAAVIRLYLLHRRNAAQAAITAAFAREHEIRARRADDRLDAQRRHELEVARVSSQGAIDPAGLATAIIAAVTGIQPQSQIIRAEVER